MLSFKNVGELVIPSTASSAIEWKLKDFYSFPVYKVDFMVESPRFQFKTECLRIILVMNGPQNWAMVQVVRADDASCMTDFVHQKGIRKSDDTLWGLTDFKQSKALVSWKISDLQNINKHCDSRTMTIFVEFSVIENRINCKAPVPSIPVEPFERLSMPCKECGHLNKNGPDVLTKNLKELYVNELYCNFTINVGDRKFKTHRAILAAQSKVFAAMVKHGLAKKETDKVDIDDCDPVAFHEFLLYVYSGQVEAFSDGSVIALYAIAEKYGVQDLKEECVNYMKSNLSVDMFCSFVELASSHGETELLKLSKEFFASNAQKIITSNNWQTFAVENAPLANELFLLMVSDS